jgi:uncharacterized membrane protein
MSKNAEYQEAYRKRREADDAWRLNTYLSREARDAVVTTSIQQGITRKDALEQLIQKGAETMQTQFRTDDPATDPGGRRSTSKPAMATIRLTAEEVAPRKPVSQPATRKESSMTTQQQKPTRMTADEAADLEQFKTKLINDHLDAREVRANGGPAGVAHKARINAMLDANNQHRQK